MSKEKCLQHVCSASRVSAAIYAADTLKVSSPHHQHLRHHKNNLQYSCLKYMTRKYEELSMKNLNAGNTSHLRPIHFLKIEFQHWKSRRVVFQTVQGSEAALVIGTALTLTYSSCHGLGSGRLMGCEIKKKGGGGLQTLFKNHQLLQGPGGNDSCLWCGGCRLPSFYRLMKPADYSCGGN